MKAACKNCRFWERGNGIANMGDCRRSAPIGVMVADSDADARSWVWPPTHGEEWCGEFLSKEAA